MVDLHTPPGALPAVGHNALRIVLFGRVDAGKSSLLGALLQSAQTQEHLLSGHLTDLTQGLAELRRRLYETAAHRTIQEIVPYAVTFQPFDARGMVDAKHPLQTLLIDCDGQVANQLLDRPRVLLGHDAEGTLAEAILNADAILLVVDVSASPAVVDADFVQFARFLSFLEHSRGRLVEISGLPVFLVLTKSDLLVDKNEADVPFQKWVQRMEDKKVKVAEHFKEFLARSREITAPFGQVNLQHVWATAVKRPALAEGPARPREPYGVAELFRQGLQEARAFRRHRRYSNWRLVRLALATLVLVAALAALAGGLIWLAHPGARPSALEVQVDRYLAQPQTPHTKFRNLRQQIVELEGWTNQPAFAKLPPGAQQALRKRLDELKAYEEYEARLNQVVDPREAQSIEQLKEIENSLTQIKVPPQYQEEWSQTKAARRHGELLEDASAIHGTVSLVEEWYRELSKDGARVLENLAAANLPARAKKVLDEAKKPPFPENDPDRLLPQAWHATYATVFGFGSVAEARRKWDGVKKRLEPVALLETP